MNRRLRLRRGTVALACMTICALDLITQAALAVTRHPGLYGGPAVPAIGLAGAVLYLRATRRRP